MIIDERLVLQTGRRAVDLEFVQQKAMTTYELSKFLRKRGVEVEWEILHCLWAIGVLVPIAVRKSARDNTPGILGVDRFATADFGLDREYLVDRGVAYEDLPIDVPSIDPESIPIHLQDTLTWHPYQFIEVASVMDSLFRRSSLRFLLRDQDDVSRDFISNRDGSWRIIVSEDGQRRASASRDLVSTLIQFDPMYRPFVVQKWVGYYTTSRNDYTDWYNKQESHTILATLGFDCDAIKKWHRDLSTAGQLKDPFGPFAGAVRSGNRTSLERLRGDALLAQDYYDAAHLLRIVAQTACSVELDYELDVARIGPRTGPTALDRRIRARHLGIAQEPLLVWFLEGLTEEDYIRAYAEAVGVDLQAHGISLHLAGGISYFKSIEFIQLLERYQDEKVFVYVSTDTDWDSRDKTNNTSGDVTDPEHVNVLRRYDAIGRLPAGLTIWERNFVESNFSYDELGNITTDILAEHGMTEVVEGDFIEQRMSQTVEGNERPLQITAEDAIEEILASKEVYDVVKGKTWGETPGDLCRCSPAH